MKIINLLSDKLSLFRWIKLESTMTSPTEVQILLIKFSLLFNDYVTEWLKSNMTSQYNNILGSDWLNCPICLVAHGRITKEFKIVQKSFKILKVCQKVLSFFFNFYFCIMRKINFIFTKNSKNESSTFGRFVTTIKMVVIVCMGIFSCYCKLNI